MEQRKQPNIKLQHINQEYPNKFNNGVTNLSESKNFQANPKLHTSINQEKTESK